MKRHRQPNSTAYQKPTLVLKQVSSSQDSLFFERITSGIPILAAARQELDPKELTLPIFDGIDAIGIQIRSCVGVISVVSLYIHPNISVSQVQIEGFLRSVPQPCIVLYFYYNKNGRKYAARKACNMISDVWKTFGIPTRRSDYPLKMLLQLHDKWIALRKSKWRDEEVHIQQRTNFDLILNELFDIGQKGNSVHTAAVNNVPDKPAVFNNSTFERNFDMSYLDNIDTDPDFEPPEKKKMKTCVSQDLSMALDRGGISNAKATMIIAATASSLGHPIEELNLSVSTIRRARMKIRKCVANEMKASFSSDDYWVVHWDGKLLPDLTDGGSGQLVDRLPVIISGKVTEQLLGAPKIETGTGASQAEAVYKCLVDWSVQGNVDASLPCSIDIQTAYDNVHIAFFVGQKRNIGITDCLIKSVYNLFKERRLTINLGSNLVVKRTKWKGLPQASPLSPMCFNRLIHRLFRSSDNTVILEDFADDITYI
ncbi:uncharacterized protein LOC134222819 [Armigeres subalbatus]|uniref:uncharacterized protein LOC134222819 n=1 Tax=Armigeres subalbatus TaxID=124917 RepID=UPI002ECFCB4F